MVKSFQVIATSAVFLLLGLSAPAYSQQGRDDQSKNQEKQNGQGKPAQQSQPQAQGQSDHQRQQPAQGQQRQQAQQPAQAQQRPQGQQRQAQQPAQAQQRPQGQQRQQSQQPSQAQQHPQGQQRQQAASPVRNQEQVGAQQGQQRQQQRQSQGQQPQPQQQAQRQQQINNGAQQRGAQQRNPVQAHQEQVAWQGNRAKNFKADHRTWQQRGGYSGYRVPNDRFSAYYGQSHGFRIYSLPVEYVGGGRRFQYEGFWFGLVDPWPEYWDSDWYDNDDVYVDYYGDGYYLYNRRYPGDRIAISFYLN